MQHTTVMPDELYDSTENLYTHAIVADGRLYMSGQVAIDETGGVSGDDIETQARLAFENVGSILTEVDLEFSDVVKVTSYLTDLRRDYDAFKAVYGEVFSDGYPCHTLLGVDELGKPDLLVELEVEAPLPDQT